MIELRVVKTVEKVNRSRSGCCHADAGLAGEFRVCAGHECGHLLVAHLDEIDFAFGALERAHDAVDSVAGVAVDAPHAPFAQPPDQKVARCLSHCTPHPAFGHPLPASRGEGSHELLQRVRAWPWTRAKHDLYLTLGS